MAESLGTITVQGKANTIATIVFENTINTIPFRAATPTASIDYSPKGDPFVYVAGTFTYAPTGAFYVPTEAAITFTATYAPIDPTRYAIEYLWDFGDDTIGYGSPIAHTFKVGSLDTQVTVQITDNRNTITMARRQVYVKATASIAIGRPVVLMGT